MPAVNQLMNAVQQVTSNRQQQQHVMKPIPIIISAVSSLQGQQMPSEEVKCGFEDFDVSEEEVNELFRYVPHGQVGLYLMMCHFLCV